MMGMKKVVYLPKNYKANKYQVMAKITVKKKRNNQKLQ
jgi:hypothetical protein